ncbi:MULTISPECIES: phasin family protein [unclassified Legionella]|uniref:phasin family protein n=1 Tax=unclassified Legionella TaxID=2622702 RepID=UPI0010563037|nr:MULTISPECIES: phasin family protein [unclassified Legionella]MDI9818968.1 phasin family protein [Legionella sp. PL877]
MQPNYINNWTSIVNQMQKPIQEIMELNAQILQNISYLKPEDLSKIRKPEELMEKQVSVFVENGHKVLDYMQESFSIFEKSLLSISKEVKNKTEQATEQARKHMADIQKKK